MRGRVLASLAAGVVAACSGGSSAPVSDDHPRPAPAATTTVAPSTAPHDLTASTARTTTPTPVSIPPGGPGDHPAADELALAFLTTIYEADTDVARLASATGSTAAGSPAEAFVEVELAVLRSRLLNDAGYAGCRISSRGSGATCPRVTAVDEGVEICDYNRSLVSVHACLVFSGFTIIDGEVVSFAIDGVDIGPRTSGPGDPVTLGPVTLQVLASYRVVPHDLFRDELMVAVDISVAQTSYAVVVGFHDATYIDPDGLEVAALRSVAPSPLPHGPASNVAVVHFPRVDPGGTVEFDVEGYYVVECSTGDGACEQWMGLGRISTPVPGLSLETDG